MALRRIVELKMNKANENHKKAQFYTQTEDGLYFWWTKWLVTDAELPEVPEEPDPPVEPDIQNMSWDLSVDGDGSVMAVGDGERWGAIKTITISGDGPIKDFTADNPSPFTDIGNTYDLIIEEGVSRIGNRAFYRSSVTEIDLPESVRSFGQFAFYNCANLARVTMGTSVALIDAGAFQACSALKEITLSSGLYTLQNGAFIGTGLTTITIPAQCSYVGKTAFQLCSDMKTCYIERSSGAAFTAGTNAFDFQSEGATIYVHGDDIAAAIDGTYDRSITSVALY